MKLAIILAVTIGSVVLVHRRGWYTLSEHIAFFGAGVFCGELINLAS